jgi:anti-anti-sigma regulatory factor
MLHVTVQAQRQEETVLGVQGWIAGISVSLLEQAVEGHQQAGQRLVLELSAVRFVDEAGLALLRRWTGEGIALRGGSPFVRKLLEIHGLE